jgi:LmbE family N-acetylglucosaminyl deacetylase
MARGSAVILSPHFDDAVLGCWSVLAGSKDVTVVNVCTGLPEAGLITAVDRNLGARESRAWVEQRIEEDADVLASVGRTAINLGLLDGQYRAYEIPELRNALEAEGADYLTIVARASFACADPERIRAALADLVPDLAELYVPAAIGGHPDHRDVNRVAVPFARAGVSVWLYADVPYAFRDFGWPGWVTGADADRAADEHLASFLAGYDGFALRRSVRRLSPEETARKIDAIRGYRTQFRMLARASSNGITDPDVMQYEALWRLTPRRS